MIKNFTIDDLMIRVMPGGFFLTVILFIFGGNIELALIDSLDFLYTFLFFLFCFYNWRIVTNFSS